MRPSTIFKELRVKRASQKMDFPEVYSDDFKAFMGYFQYQCKKKGGDIDFADYFGMVTKIVIDDESFLKENPNILPTENSKKRSKKKSQTQLKSPQP